MEQVLSAKPNNSPYKVTVKKIWRAACAEIRSHRKTVTISLILYGVSMILFFFDSCEVYNKNIHFMPSGWGLFFCGVAILTGIFTTTDCFRDLNNIQLSDVALALPIKARERFFSKIYAIALTQILPFIVSYWGGTALAILKSLALGFPLDERVWENYWMYALYLLSILMFIIASEVLSACCCGTLAESEYFAIIFMVIINVLPCVFYDNFMAKPAGFQYFLNFFSADVNLGWWGFITIADNVKMCLLRSGASCLISLCVMILPVYLFIKRDGRSVGKPIVSKIFFELMMAGGCFMIFSIFFTTQMAGWGVLVSGVAYIVINIIVSRGGRFELLKWILKFVSTLAVFILIAFIAFKTCGFGLVNWRPHERYLASSTANMTYYDYETHDTMEWGSTLLTAEEASEILNLSEYYCKKSIENISFWDMLTDNIAGAYEDGLTSVRIIVNNQNVLFADDTWGNVRAYRQEFMLPLDEARRFMESLQTGYSA